MRRKIRRLATWIIAGLTFLFVMAVVGVGLYTQTEHFRLLLREQALAALRTSINGEVALERVSGSVWQQVFLDHLSIQQNGVEVLSVPRVAVTVKLLSQLYAFFHSSTLHIANIELTAPVIRLVQDQETGWNLAHLLKPSDQPQEPQTLAIFLDRLKIEGGRIEARPAGSEEVYLTALTLDGNLALLPSGTQADVATLNFSLARAGAPEVQWTSALSYDDTVSPSMLHLHYLDLRTAGSHLLTSGTVQNLSAPTTALTVEVERLAASELQMLWQALPLQQDLSGTVHLTGPLSALQLAATLQAPDGRVTTLTTADLTNTPPQYQGTIEVQRFAIDKVLHLANLSGEVSGKLSFAWATLETAQGELHAQASGLLVQGRQVGDVALVGNLAKSQVALTVEAKGENGNAHLQSAVTLGSTPAYELTLAVRNFAVAQAIAAGPPRTANLNLDAWIKGRGVSLAQLDGAAKVTLLPSRLGTITLTRGRVAGTLHDGQVTLDEVTLLANNTTLTVQGQVGSLQESPTGKISYALHAKDLAPWLALAGRKGEGGLDLEGTLSGAFTALRLEGKATLSNLRVADSSLQSGAVTYTLTDVGSSQPRGQVTATLNRLDAGMRLRTVEAALALTGMAPAEVHANFTVRDDALRTHQLKTLVRYQPERLEARVEELILQLPTGTWHTPKSTQFVLQGRTLTIDDFQLQRADQSVSATGVFAWQGAQDLHVQVHHFSLAELRPLLRTNTEVSGYVTAEAQVQGTAAAPQIEATLTADTLTVAGQSYAGLVAQGAYRQERFNLDLRLRQDAIHTLTVEGGVPVYLGWAGERPPAVLGEADLRMRSDGLSLAFLSLLRKEVQEVQGTLSMDVQVRGPALAPITTGEIRVQQGQARVVPLGLSLTGIELQLGLDPGALRVTQFVVHSKGGQLTGTGTLALQQYALTALDVTLDADNFHVINTRQYTAAVSGQLVCSGSPQAPFLRGALTVKDTILRPDLSLLKSGPAAPDPTIVVIQSPQELAAQAQQAKQAQEQGADSPPPQQSDFYRQLGLELTVTIPRNTWVHLDAGSVELMGQIQARKSPAEDLSLTGRIETVRGWYTFQGRKFEVETGQIVLTGESTIDPSLDVVARYTLPKYKVDVVVSGTASAPTLTLRSEPGLEQADILSLLLFGKPASALNQGEAISLQSQALQMAASYVASDLQQSVAQHVGVDSLQLGVGESLSQSRISAGKYVTKDVFVSTSQSLGKKQDREVSIEYQLRTNWQLKATATPQGNNGIDLMWGKQY